MEISAKPPVVANEGAAPPSNTYRQILRSAAVIGGSSVINIAIGIIRTKALAVLLGPAGFGLAGLYGSVVGLAQQIAGLGINNSGVRQIAESAGLADAPRLARTTAALGRSALVLGALGATALVLLSRQISAATFGNDGQAAAISLLSLAVLFNVVSGGQVAKIQGLRHISDLARVNVTGALLGTLMAIPIVFFFREQGVATSLVALAGATVATSTWYSGRIRIAKVAITMSDTWGEVKALLRLGLAFMSSGLMTLGVAYAVRLLVLRSVGLEGAGLYQAAWTLGGLYVGVILQAMGADFFPRLTASAGNDAACNRLVNEQTRIGLLLATPGVIATLTYAPTVIATFYSSRFAAASEMLRWTCLGVALQVVTWPIGFVAVAKGKQALFFFSELAYSVVALGLAWACVYHFGLTGAGIAFFGSYIFHAIITYPIAHRLCGFRPSSENRTTVLILGSLTAAVFGGFYVLPPAFAVCAGTLALGLSCLYSVRMLIALVSLNHVPAPFRSVAVRLGVVPSAP